MLRLPKKVNQYVLRHALWKPGNGIVVGVSGGPDSRALLDVLARLSAKYDLRLHIAHVNYRLRGDDSDKDEELVRSLAKEYALPISVKRARMVSNKGNMEAHLRELRYRFFEQVRLRQGCDLVAVAHTQDDQAETVLLHLLRGSGMAGLKAMLPMTGNVIRPFLATTRAEVLQYCRERKLKFRIDQTNAELRFTRNRIRHRLLPYLARHFNPSIRRSLARTATLLGEEYAALEAKEGGETVSNLKEVCWLETEFLSKSPAEQRRMIRALFRTIGQKPGFTQVEEILKVMCSRGQSVRSTRVGKLKISRKNGTIQVIFL